MNHVHALVRLNGALLRAFSTSTLDELRAFMPVRLVLPYVEPILAANVAKEIEKDRLVIARAAKAGAPTGLPATEIEALFEATRAIDRRFLEQLGRLPVHLTIDYATVRPIRLRRIATLVNATRDLLDRWGPTVRLRAALQTCYAPAEFEQLLTKLLGLYAEETHALSRAVELPLLLAPVRDVFAGKLLEVMRERGVHLARQATAAAFRSRRPYSR